MSKRRLKPRNRDRSKWRIGDWQREALRLWKLRVKERAGFVCERCDRTRREDGKLLQLQAHHLIDAGVMAYAFDPMNGICLCARCHKIDKHMSAHRSPYVFMGWLEGHVDRFVHGPDRYWWWHDRYANTADTTPPKLKEYPEIVARLEQEHNHGN